MTSFLVADDACRGHLGHDAPWKAAALRRDHGQARAAACSTDAAGEVSTVTDEELHFCHTARLPEDRAARRDSGSRSLSTATPTITP